MPKILKATATEQFKAFSDLEYTEGGNVGTVVVKATGEKLVWTYTKAGGLPRKPVNVGDWLRSKSTAFAGAFKAAKVGKPAAVSMIDLLNASFWTSFKDEDMQALAEALPKMVEDRNKASLAANRKAAREMLARIGVKIPKELMEE